MRRPTAIAVLAAIAVVAAGCGGGSAADLPPSTKMAGTIKTELQEEYTKDDPAITVEDVTCVKNEKGSRCLAHVDPGDGDVQAVGIRITPSSEKQGDFLWETEDSP
jgi:hypothetical protein